MRQTSTFWPYQIAALSQKISFLNSRPQNCEFYLESAKYAAAEIGQSQSIHINQAWVAFLRK